MTLDKRQIVEELRRYDGPPVRIMEVCGTHTASIFRSGVRSILPSSISLISGPGCPVCVTAAAYIDKCMEYALKEDHVLATFGDMMKVSGSGECLSDIKGEGAQVRLIYSPMEILEEAQKNPKTTYVIAAVGFETTAPSYALLLSEMIARNVENIRLLTAIKTVLPALRWICETEERIDAFLCPGHVSTVIGSRAYEGLAGQYQRPFVVTGFEPEHILVAVYDIIRQCRQGKAQVHNFYQNAVSEDGNKRAKALLSDFYEAGDAAWRGLGVIAGSALYLKPEYARYDAGSRAVGTADGPDPAQGCRCGDVVRGRINPDACPMFAVSCTPVRPYGPCMVSGEGACGIWYAATAHSQR